MRSHESYQEQIPPYLAGRLENGERASLEEHLRHCGDCASLEEIGRVFVGNLRDLGGVPSSVHPSSSALRDHARGTGEQDPGLAAHVGSCLSCRVEVEAWIRLEREDAAVRLRDRRSPSPASARRSWTWLAAAAGVALGFLLARGVLPGPRPPRDRPAEAWSGDAALLTLEPPSRGDGELPLATADPGQPYLPVAVTLALPAGTRPEEEIRVGITDDARERWSHRLTAGRIAAQQRATGVVTFLVPLDPLGAGRLTFHAVRVGAEGQEEDLLDVPFELQRQSPAATNAPQ